ncbi:unnamed protein product, partial [Laminaria digitata]
EAERDSSTSRQRHTLVPSGFECIAHPVFFRSEPFAPPPPSPAALRGATSTTTIRASVSAWNEEDDGGLIAALGTEELEGGSDCDAGGDGHASDGGGSGREVDVECPICLGRFERQVTLTSCLHTFCHTCILGWYEHTVAVALSRGGPSAFRPPERGPAAIGSRGGNSSRGGGGGSSGSGGGGAPEPYRCPLCKVPGPYFLASKHKDDDKEKHANKDRGRDRGKDTPKLTFRLLGVRTVLGGGGPTSGGVEVETASGGGGQGGEGGGVGVG